MDSRGRANQSRSYQQERDTHIRYRIESNAALQPEIDPNHPQPQRREQPRVKPDFRVLPGKDKANKPKYFKRFMGITLTLAFTATACMLLMGNAAIYQNNRNIQKLGKEIQSSIIEVNGAKKTLAEATDIEKYLAMAEDLGMSYPEAGQIIKLELEPSKAEYEELTEIQKSGGVFDGLLDWLNSLERRS